MRYCLRLVCLQISLLLLCGPSFATPQKGTQPRESIRDKSKERPTRADSSRARFHNALGICASEPGSIHGYRFRVLRLSDEMPGF
jgi:hypothetical protein